MAGQGAVADSLIGDSGESRLQSCQKLGAQLVIDLVACIIPVDIAADILVEQDRVCHLVGILTETPDRDVQIETDVFVDNTEGNRACGAVLVADDVLGIEIIDTLILGCDTAVGDTRRELFETLFNAVSEAAGEDAGLRGCVIGVGTGFRADIHDCALVDDDHALTFIDNDRGTVCNHVFASALVQEA